MNKLKEVIAYILLNYDYKDGLSNDYLNKVIYLVDWKNCIEYKKQLTHIKWYFDHYGPFVRDIEKEIFNNPKLFKSKMVKNILGIEKRYFYITTNKYIPSLITKEKTIIDHILNVSKKKKGFEFTQLIYSTYPIVTSHRYTYLNLVEKARSYDEYKKEDLYKNS